MRKLIPRHVHDASEVLSGRGNILLNQVPPMDWTRMAFDTWTGFIAQCGSLAQTQIASLLGSWANMAATGALGLLDFAADIWSGVINGQNLGTFGVTEDYGLEKFAAGFFSADSTGRSKFAQQFVDETLIAVDAVTASRIKNAEVSWDKLTTDVKTKISATAKWFSEAETGFSFVDSYTTIISDATASGELCIQRLSTAPTNTFFYGQYITMDAGNYWVLFRLKVASNASDANLVKIDCVCTRGSLGERQLHPNDFEQSNVWQTFAVPAEIRQNDTGIEFRGMNFQTGVTTIYCDYVAVIPMTKISTDLLEAYCVTAPKIAAGIITVDKMSANSIDTNQLVAGAVVSSKLALWRLTSDPSVTAGMLWWRSDLNQIRFYDGSTIQWIPKFPINFSTTNIVNFSWSAFLAVCNSGLSAINTAGNIATGAINALAQVVDGFFSGLLGRNKFADDLALPFTKLEATPYKLPTSAYNYIVNPSYEYGTWGGDETEYAFPKFGNKAIMLSANYAVKNTGYSNYVDIRGTDKITLSTWLCIWNWVTGTFYGQLFFYDSNKNYISYVDWYSTTGSNFNYTQISRTYTVATEFPANTAYIRLKFCWWKADSQPKGDAVIDAVQVNFGDQVPVFQDFTTYSYNWCPEKIETVLTTATSWSSTDYTDILQLDFDCEATMLILAFGFASVYAYRSADGIILGEIQLTVDDTPISGTHSFFGVGETVSNLRTIHHCFHTHTVLVLTKGTHHVEIQFRVTAGTSVYAHDRRLTIIKGFYKGGTT